jgi:hypothetical protein
VDLLFRVPCHLSIIVVTNSGKPKLLKESSAIPLIVRSRAFIGSMSVMTTSVFVMLINCLTDNRAAACALGLSSLKLMEY